MQEGCHSDLHSEMLRHRAQVLTGTHLGNLSVFMWKYFSGAGGH